MKWELKKRDGSGVDLQVEVPWDDVAADYEDVFEEYEKAPVPGFRPGKTPRSVVERHYRRDIHSLFTSRCAQRVSRDILKQESLEPAGPLTVSEIECEKGKPLTYTARFVVMPDFALPDYRSYASDLGSAEDAPDVLSHRLLKDTIIDPPDELVKTELRFDGLQDSPRDSEEWAAARQRVKLMMILRRIAAEEGVEIEERYVEERIAEKAREFGMTPRALRDQLQQGGGIHRIRDLLLAEAVFDYLSGLS